MGQYWIPVNLDKKEYVSPHKLGTGLKLWEQLANHPGTGAALIILTAAMPEARGGGDFDEHDIVGRWAGDRIAIVGDYAEEGDLAPEHQAHLIYGLCNSEEDRAENLKYYAERFDVATDSATKAELQRKIDELTNAELYTDISDDVAEVIENELQGRYEDKGWRTFVRARPDLPSALDEFDSVLELAQAAEADVPDEFPAMEVMRELVANLVREDL